MIVFTWIGVVVTIVGVLGVVVLVATALGLGERK